jgi:hypothetical protein
MEVIFSASMAFDFMHRVWVTGRSPLAGPPLWL